MTDEITAQNQPKKDEKKSNTANSRGPKKSNAGGGGSNQGAPRPSSRSSIKKPSSNAPTASADSGSDTKKGPEGKKTEQRSKSQSGGRGGSNRKGQPSRQGPNVPKDQSVKSSSPAPVPGAESSEALSSLQRVINDLKTTSPPAQSSPLATNSLSASMHAPQPQSSNLTPNAPVFQPGGAVAYQGLGQGMSPADAARHRKAASLGPPSALSNNFNSFSPHLGAMMEDAEDGGGNVYEEGEIQEGFYQQPGHQPRSQSQSFMAPRFAALAAQQDQGDSMGPTGRPQLAPGFMFGARGRGSTGPMAPPINEDDLSFQFPQQQQQRQQHFAPEAPPTEQGHKKSDSAEIGGIMAEQVRII